MWELNYKECWAPKIWCFWTVVLKKILESPLDCKEIQPVHPKGNQSWIFIGRTDAEAETPVLWPLDEKKWLIWKDPDAQKEWRQEEQGMTEDKMVGWYHRLNEHEFEQALGVGDGKGGLVCCLPWGSMAADTTERLNWKVWLCCYKPDLTEHSNLFRIGETDERNERWNTVGFPIWGRPGNYCFIIVFQLRLQKAHFTCEKSWPSYSPRLIDT